MTGVMSPTPEPTMHPFPSVSLADYPTTEHAGRAVVRLARSQGIEPGALLNQPEYRVASAMRALEAMVATFGRSAVRITLYDTGTVHGPCAASTACQLPGIEHSRCADRTAYSPDSALQQVDTFHPSMVGLTGTTRHGERVVVTGPAIDPSRVTVRPLVNRDTGEPCDPRYCSPFAPQVRHIVWDTRQDSTLRCLCPDDCNCRHPWRMNYCGCKAHGYTVPFTLDRSTRGY